MNKTPYKEFNEVIIRTPLFSFDFYRKLFFNEEVNDSEIKKALEDKALKEALFLASPELYNEVFKWINGKIEDDKKIERLKITIIKYFSRISSRSTPFGLFAGCGIGYLSQKETELTPKNINKHKRHTRLDMNYLISLSQDISKKEEIREQLLFYPNSSIYKIGDKYRYIEYSYFNTKRIHHIVAIDKNEIIDAILNRAQKGATIHDLANEIVNEEIEYEDAFDFILEIVSSQILISELEPSILGSDFLNHIIKILEKLKNTDVLLTYLIDIRKLLNVLDNKIGNEISTYKKIISVLKDIGTEFNPKYVFQTDLNLEFEKNNISKDLIVPLKKAMAILNSSTLKQANPVLKKFCEKLYQRYEERPVSLALALDIESGIGYNQNNLSADINPLVDDLSLNPGRESFMEIKWSTLNDMLQEKLTNSNIKNSNLIKVRDDDFVGFNNDWDDLPDTLYGIVNIVNINGEIKIVLDGYYGSSAGNLIGRFCNGNKDFEDFVNKICEVEKKINQDKVLAEIAHLPESRIGNILMRPSFREYEIPYLSNSTKSNDKKININDLKISASYEGKIKLTSKLLKKEIKPCLTNAHNFSYNSLPVYNLLCDIQNQGRNHLSIGFGPLANTFNYLPRLEYENVILSKATWNIKKEKINYLFLLKEKFSLMKAINEWREEMKIPKLATLIEGDNYILINFENIDFVNVFLSIIRNQEFFILTEFLFGENDVINNREGGYVNEFIFSFFNESKLKN
ncbi:lantibiotic dehydratase family protein [Tenacibaculum ascidiaceicola]|uniref:lantibiotic dehydratase family protein n=1 Tax=Tenacibaculum ascidiaceicola TaxID=1699411 RepID=UPI003CE51823